MREADVVIVGAGLSGLVAARELVRAGYEPVVLEASDRVGGRILSEEVQPGVFLELGAQWIGDTHDRMRALAGELWGCRFTTSSRTGRPATNSTG
ncbi:FAD-dependent oxidoreductase [Demetria terragena]|uniref:flavin monoamine oxidase family protein n=1 Tax=Demetria terragena TaxID=63959 RepID=UPI0012EA9AD1